MSGPNRRGEMRPPAQPATTILRNNEYFLPKEGIDREVITSDICRYLGNDALVRPGVLEHPVTRQPQNGYIISAYRNLTTEMIADLKQDSARWEAERRAAAPRNAPSNVVYRDSNTHQSRQYYGPTEPPPAPGQGGYGSTPGGSQVIYNNEPSYSQQQPLQQGNYNSQAPGPGYSQPGYGPPADNNYYVAGADYRATDSSIARNSNPPVTQAGVNVPRTNTSTYAVNPPYQQPDNRSPYSYQAGAQVSSGPSYPSQQYQDPNYGRGAYRHETKSPTYGEKRKLSNFLAGPSTDNSYASQDQYDNRPNYQDVSMGGTYTQTSAPVSQSIPAVVPNTGSRREQRDRDPEPRERHGGHRSSRR